LGRMAVGVAPGQVKGITFGSGGGEIEGRINQKKRKTKKDKRNVENMVVCVQNVEMLWWLGKGKSTVGRGLKVKRKRRRETRVWIKVGSGIYKPMEVEKKPSLQGSC